jgi:phosphate transport system protein
MAIHFQREVDGLKRKTLSLSTLVEENLGRAVRAVAEKNDSLAHEVISADDTIDAREIEVEEDCLKLLALYQPVAVDLRFIVAVLKMNSDLERIGDLSVNIAERSLALKEKPPVDFSSCIDCMAEKVLTMVKNSLDSMVNIDVSLAMSVCASDDEVDALYREMYDRVKKGIVADSSKLDDLMQLSSISRHLERIADHATNIAEDVIYMAEGAIFRHRVKGKGGFA